ncbi:MAG: amino acid ABC transporter permease [Clostridiales bacterium]|nr:amino acid ABC transporter permease [Clostridiales bacterium]
MGSGPFALFRWQKLFSDYRVFAEGLGVTLVVAVLALLLALLIGVALGMLSSSGVKPLQAIARVYVEFFQNTPLVIQVFFVYNALPTVGIMLDVFSIGVLVIGLYHGAYVAEVVRAGIQSIPKGQTEASRSQGFTYIQTMRYVILPQTIQIILPPLTNQAVNLIKNTSAMAVVAGGDLMYRADSWASNGFLSYGPAYIVTGVLYFLLCFPLASFARKYEEKLKSRDLVQTTAELAVVEEVVEC